MIKVYTIPECPYCSELKERLDDMDIKYEVVDINDEENEDIFDRLMQISGSDSVPMVTVGSHLLAPNVNFNSIEQAASLVQHILNTEDV